VWVGGRQSMWGVWGVCVAPERDGRKSSVLEVDNDVSNGPCVER